jgi:hypothetical protein
MSCEGTAFCCAGAGLPKSRSVAAHIAQQPQEVISKLGQESRANAAYLRQIQATFGERRHNITEDRVTNDQERRYPHFASDFGSPRGHCGEPRIVV